MAGRYTKYESNIFSQKVKELYDQGKTALEIADTLHSMPSTVKRYIQEIEAQKGIEIDTLDRRNLIQEVEEVRAMVKKELAKQKPNHLLLQRLTERECKLIELANNIPNRQDTPNHYIEPEQNLTEDQISRIADILEEDA